MFKLFKEFFVRSAFRSRKEHDAIVEKSAELSEDQIQAGQLMHHLRPKGQLADAFALGVKWGESKHGIRPPMIPPEKCLHMWTPPKENGIKRVHCMKCGDPFPLPTDDELLSKKEKDDHQSKP